MLARKEKNLGELMVFFFGIFQKKTCVGFFFWFERFFSIFVFCIFCFGCLFLVFKILISHSVYNINIYFCRFAIIDLFSSLALG